MRIFVFIFGSEFDIRVTLNHKRTKNSQKVTNIAT
jgi:hypothetical protein